MQATEYATRIAVFVPDPGLRQNLLDAAAALDAVIGAPAAVRDPALAAYRQAIASARRSLIDAALALAPLPELRAAAQRAVGDGLQLEAEARLGPLSIGFTSPAATLADPQGGPPIRLGPLPPDAFRAALDTGPVRADGTLLARPPDGLAGLLTAAVGTIEVAALASFAERDGAPSFLAVLSAGFTPGLQLGFGFQINRIGGVIGINRTVAPEALAARLKDGAAATALFPLDAGPAARRALEAADAIFAPRRGAAVAGPTVRLSWLEVAGAGFASVDAAVLVSAPGPRIVIVGAFRASIPGTTALMRLNADLAGVLDFAGQRATIDASLHDSGALAIFTVYGDLAFATSWGAHPYTVLSLGGFYPGYRPEPAQIRPLARLGLALDSPLPGLRLRAEGYLAATDNTLQLGGWIEVGIDAGIASVSGHLGADAIIQFTPFRFKAEVVAGLSVRFLGKTFAGVRFNGALEGPGPVTLHGRVVLETFLKDFDWEDTFVFGRPETQAALPARRAIALLAAEAFGPRSVRAAGGGDPSVAIASPDRIEDFAVVAPLGGVVWSQHGAPFEIAIDRLGGAPLGSAQFLRVSAENQTDRPRERFAPGSFITLTQAQALAAPVYEALPSGVVVGSGPALDGGSRPADDTPRILRKVAGETPGLFPHRDFPLAAFASGLIAIADARDRPAAVADRTARVIERPAPWLTAGDRAEHETATQAIRASMRGAGAALAAADAAAPVVLEGL